MRLLAEDDGKQRVLDTERLSLTVIQRRIQQFQTKHGGKLSAFSRSVSCDTSDFSTLRDLMEWEMLEKELRQRKSTNRKKADSR